MVTGGGRFAPRRAGPIQDADVGLETSPDAGGGHMLNVVRVRARVGRVWVNFPAVVVLGDLGDAGSDCVHD